MEGTTGLKFQLHQRRKSFSLLFFKARDKIHIFMMLQPIMKGEKSGRGENIQSSSGKAWLCSANQPRRRNITAISILSLKFWVFFHFFFHLPNASSQVLPSHHNTNNSNPNILNSNHERTYVRATRACLDRPHA